MSAESPASILFSSDGIELAVQNGVSTPANTRGIIATGQSADGYSRFIKLDTLGNVIVAGSGTAGSPAGGVLTIQGSPTGTPIPISGSITATSSGNATPSDGYANPSNASLEFSLLAGFNGTTWDRLRTGTTNADAVANLTLGALQTGSYLYGYNGATWDRLRSSTANGLVVDVTRIQTAVTANQGTSNTLANAWATKITDTTNGPVAVKAASTAAIATDPALVVAISPNNSVTTVGGTTPADAFANPTTAQTDFSLQAGFNGTTWDRLRTQGSNADAISVLTLGVQTTAGYLYGFNGTTWDRLRSSTTNGLVVDVSRVQGVVSPPVSATSTLSNVAASASNVTLLAANSARLGATIYNDSNNVLYVKLGTTASTTSFTIRLLSQSYWEVPFNYTGRIDGIWNGSNGSARMDELTA
jgi:hypothetical protein